MLKGMSFIVWGFGCCPVQSGEIVSGPKSGFVLCDLQEAHGPRLALLPVSDFRDQPYGRSGSIRLFRNREARLDWEKNCALMGSYYY